MMDILHFFSDIHTRVYPLRFHFLLIALLCVFVVNIFFPDNIYGGIAQLIYLPFQIIACVLVYKSKKRVLYLLGLIILFLIAFSLTNIFFSRNIENEMCFFYICFFGSVFWEVIYQIYRTNLYAIQIVLAGVCGILLIGYVGFYIFLAIELYQPGSFNNVAQGAIGVNDLFYFSFITILTVGYGHFTPNTWIADNAVILVSLAAYVYSWVVIATIVSEATTRKSKKTHDSAHEKVENS